MNEQEFRTGRKKMNNAELLDYLHNHGFAQDAVEKIKWKFNEPGEAEKRTYYVSI